MMMKQKNIPFVLEYNGKTYRITGLCEMAGPHINAPDSELKHCYADFLYNGKWHTVQNAVIKSELREIYDKS